MYTLHIANKNYSSWSLRPWVLMTELAIPFTEVLHPFAAGSNWETFRKFSPNGLVPCLVTEDEVVWDSLAIAEYLAERHEGVWPVQAEARTWARCATAEMHSGFSTLRNVCSMSCGVRVKLHEVSAALSKDLARLDELWQMGLTRFGGPFLAGANFSAVDAFFAPVAFRIQSYDLKLSDSSLNYAQKLLSLAGMQRWQAAALAETWREPGHEEDTVRYGSLVTDMRRK